VVQRVEPEVDWDVSDGHSSALSEGLDGVPEIPPRVDAVDDDLRVLARVGLVVEVADAPLLK
jgi:hypothetical protein